MSRGKRKLFYSPAVQKPSPLGCQLLYIIVILRGRWVMDNGKRVVSRGLRLTVLFNVWLTKQRRKNLGVAECTPAVNHHSLGDWLHGFFIKR